MDSTYFLHLLVNDPARVIPAGKSLLSMVAQPSVLHTVAHQAFWDDAEQVLSDPLPSVQLPRLHRLYRDLLDALSPLFPPGHPILLSLSSPLPPTSSPLRSTLSFLHEILRALRQRCAPLRDPTIDHILSHNSPLPHLVVHTIKGIVALAEDMKSDLGTFLLGSMSESQLRDLLAKDLRKRERELVLDAWNGILPVKAAWDAWIPSDHHQPWVLSLLRALASDMPLLFSTPQLLYIQNYLQALVIAAALRSLTRLPSLDFMTRVWALLNAEIDPLNPSDNTTKLINLADEVLRARQSPDPQEQSRLRAAVERTIRPDDPVFILLKKRLISALEVHLTASEPLPSSIPLKMQTGRVPDSFSPSSVLVRPLPSIPGFEEPVLQQAIAEVSQKIINCVTWTNSVWH